MQSASGLRSVAIYCNLGLITRTGEEAEACAAFFSARRLIVAGQEVPLQVWLPEMRAGGESWQLFVWPQGMSVGSPMGNNPRLTDPEVRERVAQVFDCWLSEAPPFAAGWFGEEASDYFRELELSSLRPDSLPDGFVVDAATWVSLGRPAEARDIGLGRSAWPRRSS